MYKREILTDLGIKYLFLLEKYHYEKAGNCLKPHFHKDMMEIVHCHCETQVYEVDNQQYRIKDSEIFITFFLTLSAQSLPEHKHVNQKIVCHL
jgi:hypothetical protein